MVERTPHALQSSEALGLIHRAMFALPQDHVTQQYLLIVEAFLQRELFGEALAKVSASQSSAQIETIQTDRC